VQKDDILETDAAGAQVEAGPQAIVALGPHTRVLLGNPATDVALLEGWVKVSVKTGRSGAIATPALAVTLASGSAIVGAGKTAGLDAVFAEEGAQQAARVDANGKPGGTLKLAAEQYAAIDPAKPQPVAGRPPRAFITAMPPAFRDGLAPAPPVRNAGKVQPVRERDADYADVAAWLAAPLSARRDLLARFKPRLADPAFRKALERDAAAGPEWKAALQPPRPGPARPRPAPAAPSGSALF
jgi:hypothetical protein